MYQIASEWKEKPPALTESLKVERVHPVRYKR
ncbi:uncharacterized protein METZ01_LOCUS153625 [marine metagenome]|uniref:Uncharacterized protein n=1 Tax=marine metagenome TaxID=408172 RepID=A0A382AHK9_9ZZZZ